MTLELGLDAPPPTPTVHINPESPAKPPSTAALITRLQEADQDFEWYPTTDQIIGALVKDLRQIRYNPDSYDRFRSYETLLDVGAGNGQVLRKVRDYLNRSGGEDGRYFDKLYAIEKSPLLIQQLDTDIFVVGTDFMEQTLLNKEASVVFSNPPYSVFAEWTVKLIRECAAPLLYLVIPVRWQEDRTIADALAFRQAKTEIVGTFDFEKAERRARARVHLVRVLFESEKDDAFARFFDEEFAGLKERYESARKERKDEAADADESHSKFSSLVVGESYPVAMVHLYQQDLANVRRNYDLASQLDVDLMKEFEITPARIMAGLKTRLGALRTLYWNELFSRLTAVTDRLTTKNRQNLLGTLRERVYVDFTVSNIHAIILWIIKNASAYLDSQLIDTFEKLVAKANVKLYKSNKRPFEWDRWRYNESRERSTHFYLEYRLVLHGVGGIRNEWSGQQLADSAAEYLQDLMTVARNLGFICDTAHPHLLHGRRGWRSNELKTFDCIHKDKHEVLFEARAFQNRNIHLRLNQKFALALNVEFGRLRGWLASKEAAVTELDNAAAAQYFGTQHQLPATSRLLLAA